MTRRMQLLPVIAALMALGNVHQAADAAEADQKPSESDRAEARRRLCRKNLGQLAIAMHNFHAAFGSFPPHASYDGKKPLLSWRVYLLPFLDANDLYKQFRLDEPWDSPHNRRLIEKMPAVFACPSALGLAKDGKTVYLAPIGPKMVMTGKKEGAAIRDITDGTSNTIMFVDVDRKHAVVWTKPDDLEVDLDKPAEGLGTAHGEGFTALFCDGSRRLLRKDLDPEILWRLFIRDDGKPIPGF